MYRIKIEQTEELEVVKREWKQIADSGNKEDGGAIYDYVEYPGVKEETTLVYEQSFDEIELASIIKAANGIKG